METNCKELIKGPAILRLWYIREEEGGITERGVIFLLKEVFIQFKRNMEFVYSGLDGFTIIIFEDNIYKYLNKRSIQGLAWHILGHISHMIEKGLLTAWGRFNFPFLKIQK